VGAIDHALACLLECQPYGCIVMMVATAVAPLPPIYYLYGIRVPGLIWLFHLDNIQRLLAGQERRIGRSGQATSGSR
jgi:glycerol-3-phosphate acyltransferase PlsY